MDGRDRMESMKVCGGDDVNGNVMVNVTATLLEVKSKPSCWYEGQLNKVWKLW